MKSTIRTAIGMAWVAFASAAGAEQGRWATPDDATAQTLIALERQWAEQECTHKIIVDTLLADDFQGTSPAGARYNKAEAIKQAETSTTAARDCHLDEVSFQYFGDSMAVAYGSERFTTMEDGSEQTRCLVWTDTWLKRNGNWQIIAAQDMWAACT